MDSNRYSFIKIYLFFYSLLNYYAYILPEIYHLISTQQQRMNIAADDQCLTEFQNLKYNKIDARYITFVIVDEKIVIEKVGAKNETWDEFLQTLPENDYRYCVFDFEFTKSDNMHINKLIFLSWNPEGSPLKKRVLYATAKQNFKSYLDMNTKDYTLNSKSDMTKQDMIKELSK